jgi:7-cyano-7-deazaguanine synthase in queuosine biosynthesis
MAKDLAIVLNNGSINSAVVTALAAQKYRLILLYGEAVPDPGSRQRAAYDQQIQHFKPYREHTLSMPFLTILQGPSKGVASNIDTRGQQHVAAKSAELLPLLAAAARFAIHYQTAAIYLGLRTGPHSEELTQATEYIQIWNELLQLPLQQPDVEFTAPLLELDPWQIIDLGFQISAPLERTWSCIEETSEPCWACAGCRAREEAFVQAGKADPMKVVRKV